MTKEYIKECIDHQKEYIEQQISRLEKDSPCYMVQIVDFSGNKTNWFSLDYQSVQTIKHVLFQAEDRKEGMAR